MYLTALLILLATATAIYDILRSFFLLRFLLYPYSMVCILVPCTYQGSPTVFLRAESPSCLPRLC